MRVEVPEFKRCCFCMPLRRGVLTWAYIKVVLIILMVYVDINQFRWMSQDRQTNYVFLSRVIIVFIIKVTALALSIFLIVAGHMKNSRLLRISYMCELVSVVSVFVVFVSVMVFDFIVYTWLMMFLFRFIFLFIVIQIIYIGVQLYVIALIRSEVLKLEAAHEFRFVNNAAEAHCRYYEGADLQGGGADLQGEGVDLQGEGADLQGEGTELQAEETDNPTPVKSILPTPIKERINKYCNIVI